MGLWATQLSGDLDDARLALERERASAAVLADPNARTVALEAGTGRLVVGSDEGRPCSSWTISTPRPQVRPTSSGSSKARARLAAGLFPGRDGIDVVGLEGTVDTGAVVAVTLEEAGGVEVSQNDPIVASAPV